MNDLGYCYRNGYGCEKNEKKAVELYKTAADRGNAQGKIFFLIKFIEYKFNNLSFF